MQFEQHFLLAAIRHAGRGFFFNLDTGALRQPAHGGEEIQIFVLHHELEDIATGTAAEAMPDLLAGRDIKARCFFFVEWAKRPEVRTGFFQWEICADDVHHVIRVANLLDDLIGNASRHSYLNFSLNLIGCRCVGKP